MDLQPVLGNALHQFYRHLLKAFSHRLNALHALLCNPHSLGVEMLTRCRLGIGDLQERGLGVGQLADSPGEQAVGSKTNFSLAELYCGAVASPMSNSDRHVGFAQ